MNTDSFKEAKEFLAKSLKRLGYNEHDQDIDKDIDHVRQELQQRNVGEIGSEVQQDVQMDFETRYKEALLKIHDLLIIPFQACKTDDCRNCTPVVSSSEFTSTITGEKFKCKYEFADGESPGVVSCSTKNLIYLFTCNQCKEQYVGETGTKFALRMNNHRSEATPYVKKHFYDPESKCYTENIFNSISIHIIQKLPLLVKDPNTSVNSDTDTSFTSDPNTTVTLDPNTSVTSDPNTSGLDAFKSLSLNDSTIRNNSPPRSSGDSGKPETSKRKSRGKGKEDPKETKKRLLIEDEWIIKLGTFYPFGMNDKLSEEEKNNASNYRFLKPLLASASGQRTQPTVTPNKDRIVEELLALLKNNDPRPMIRLKEVTKTLSPAAKHKNLIEDIKKRYHERMQTIGENSRNKQLNAMIKEILHFMDIRHDTDKCLIH